MGPARNLLGLRNMASTSAPSGERVVRERFGVDADTCTGDHACIRISGCPSLTIKDNPDPMRTDPVATVIDSCVGCGVCGANAHAAALCPSFYRTDVVINPTRLDLALAKARRRVIGALSAGLERRAAGLEAGPVGGDRRTTGANSRKHEVRA